MHDSLLQVVSQQNLLSLLLSSAKLWHSRLLLQTLVSCNCPNVCELAQSSSTIATVTVNSINEKDLKNRIEFLRTIQSGGSGSDLKFSLNSWTSFWPLFLDWPNWSFEFSCNAKNLTKIFRLLDHLETFCKVSIFFCKISRNCQTYYRIKISESRKQKNKFTNE